MPVFELAARFARDEEKEGVDGRDGKWSNGKLVSAKEAPEERREEERNRETRGLVRARGACENHTLHGWWGTERALRPAQGTIRSSLGASLPQKA